MILEFYKRKEDKKPHDVYLTDYPKSPKGEMEYAIYNWMQMYPEGKVIVRK